MYKFLLILISIVIVVGVYYYNFQNQKSTDQIIDTNGGEIIIPDTAIVSFDPGLLKDGTLVKVSKNPSPSLPLSNTEIILSPVISITFPSSALSDLPDSPTAKDILKGVVIKIAKGVLKNNPDGCTTIRTVINNDKKIYAKYSEEHQYASAYVMRSYIREGGKNNSEIKIETLISTLNGCPN